MLHSSKKRVVPSGSVYPLEKTTPARKKKKKEPDPPWLIHFTINGPRHEECRVEGRVK